MRCAFCYKRFSINPFIPKNKEGTPLFTMNVWFFAYCKCDCGEFIFDKKLIQEKENGRANSQE